MNNGCGFFVAEHEREVWSERCRLKWDNNKSKKVKLSP
jgi:hypothetical protein